MTTERRPDPDELLARVKEAETRQARGKLKIFFGAAAGVGKTYAMLEAARQQRAQGIDVVVGWVCDPRAAETEALLGGLEIPPRRALDYRRTASRSSIYDAAVPRLPCSSTSPATATRPLPARRAGRRLELLDAHQRLPAMNVQYVESLNDVREDHR
jgi:two-component system sensor histidine kinase KdpD